MVEILKAAEYGRVQFGKEMMEASSPSKEGLGNLYILGNRCFRCSRTLRTDLLDSMYRVPSGV